MDVTIRRATVEDESAILEVHRRAVQAIDRRFYTETQIASWGGRLNPAEEAALEEILGCSDLLVAVRAGRVVGFAQLVPAGGEVRAVYVDPEVGGRGVGSALLDRLEGIAVERGLEDLELRASLNAVPFYRARGWTATEETTHRLVDGTEIPCVRMRKSVS